MIPVSCPIGAAPDACTEKNRDLRERFRDGKDATEEKARSAGGGGTVRPPLPVSSARKTQRPPAGPERSRRRLFCLRKAEDFSHTLSSAWAERALHPARGQLPVAFLHPSVRSGIATTPAHGSVQDEPLRKVRRSSLHIRPHFPVRRFPAIPVIRPGGRVPPPPRSCAAGFRGPGLHGAFLHDSPLPVRTMGASSPSVSSVGKRAGPAGDAPRNNPGGMRLSAAADRCYNASSSSCFLRLCRPERKRAYRSG